MKKLYLIGGTMGVGKTTTSRLLCDILDKSVFLDGDWCWDSHPFQVTEETKAMVVENICFLLNSFLHCSAYENVVFCWVMHQQAILDSIVSRLDTQNVRLLPVSLIASEEALRARLESDVAAGVRSADIIERSLARIPMYAGLDTIKLDVSAITAAVAAQRLARL